MSPQTRIVARLRRLVKDAERAGLALVADAESGSGGIRVMPSEEVMAEDLTALGTYVPLHSACGGSKLATGNVINQGRFKEELQGKKFRR